MRRHAYLVKVLVAYSIGLGTAGCNPPPDRNPNESVGAIDAGMAGACSELCTLEGVSRCDGTAIQVCTSMTNGCLEWSTGTDCVATNDQCDDSSGSATCIVDCGLHPTYALAVSVVGAGAGVVRSSPLGIECGLQCNYDFAQDCPVVLEAIPDSYSTFLGWTGGCVGTGLCTLTQSTADSGTVSASFSSTATHLWSASFGSTGFDFGRRLAVDSEGNLFVAGSYHETINFGGSPIPNASDSTDVFVAKFSAAGEHLWSRGMGGIGGDELSDMTVDSNDDVVIAGQFRDVVDFGGGEITAIGANRDFFVAKYSGVNGAHLWSRGLGGVNDEFAHGVATDSSNDVYVTGTFRSLMNFGEGFVSPESFDVFVAKYASENGADIWATQYGGPNIDKGQTIEIDAMDNVLIAGSGALNVDFGGGPIATEDVSLFLVKLNGMTAAHLWSVGFGPSATTFLEDMALDANGNAYLVGTLTAPTDILGIELVSAGSKDMFVARFSGVDGAVVWAKSHGGPSLDVPTGIDVNGGGEVAVIGTFRDAADFGVGALQSSGGNDIVVHTLTEMGVDLSATRFGGTAGDEAGDIILTDSGSWILAGGFSGVVDLGGGPLTSAGGLDLVVWAIDPQP